MITDEEVTEALQPSGSEKADAPSAEGGGGQSVYASLSVARENISQRAKLTLANKVFLGLPTLSRLFNLNELEETTILVCLAPEIDAKYAKIYGYLQDDVTKKRPTVDLLFRLFCETEGDRLSLVRMLSPQSALLHFNLVRLVEEAQDAQVPLASRYLKLDDRIIAYLLQHPFIDPRLEASVKNTHPQDIDDDDSVASKTTEELLRFVNSSFQGLQNEGSKRIIVYLSGSDEGGKRSFAEAICRQMKVGLVSVDLADILARNLPFEWAIRTLLRETILLPAALFIHDIDAVLEDEKNKPALQLMEKNIEELGWLIMIAGERDWFPRDTPRGVTFISQEVSIPSASARKELWTTLSREYNLEEGLDFELVASKFLFGRDRIEIGLRQARSVAMKRDGADYTIRMKDIYDGCRAQSSNKLLSMSQKVKPVYSWDDIVLPEDSKNQLREICDSVKNRSRVHEEWGFEKKFSLGKGLNILFTGASGTGKTMAAEVIANELQLDMYKIDLSSVVSKWVGETEKNISRVFKEARDTNAIIFFDEADALFGKRTEVKDAHDRYANIEVNFLLQKMEEHEGIVILASNFKENIDKAFLRRMHHTLEFPFPDEESRLRIWGNIFPKAAPLAGDVDMVALARRFKISGGNIKNAAVNAAFYAAEESSPIGTKHILRALKREYQKIGTLPSEPDFETGQN